MKSDDIMKNETVTSPTWKKVAGNSDLTLMGPGEKNELHSQTVFATV